MGYQPVIVNTLFLVILSKKGQFHEKSHRLTFWSIIESLQNQTQNICYFSILCV